MKLFKKRYLVRIWTDCLCGNYTEKAGNAREAYDLVVKRLGHNETITKAEVYLDGKLELKI